MQLTFRSWCVLGGAPRAKRGERPRAGCNKSGVTRLDYAQTPLPSLMRDRRSTDATSLVFSTRFPHGPSCHSAA
eukprot:1870708-Pyramimonas_sp.AAC.1